MFRQYECVETREGSRYDPAAGFVISHSWHGVVEVYLHGYGIVHIHEERLSRQGWFIKQEEAIRLIEAEVTHV